jgi:DNA-damage-inducible protein J
MRLMYAGERRRQGFRAAEPVRANGVKSWRGRNARLSPRFDVLMEKFPPREVEFSALARYIVAQGENAMATNSVVRARIDQRIKGEAAAVLAAMGLTVSDAFRLMMVRIAQDKALPFAPLAPNADTIEAMKAARRGDVVSVGSPDKLLGSLNAGD